jgi:hypothetical protein
VVNNNFHVNLLVPDDMSHFDGLPQSKPKFPKRAFAV